MRLGAVVVAMLLCAGFSAAGLGYVWHKNRNEQLHRELRLKRSRVEELRNQDQYLGRQWADMHSHRALEERVRQLGLGLVMPQPEQILRLPDGSPLSNQRQPAAAAVVAAQPPRSAL